MGRSKERFTQIGELNRGLEREKTEAAIFEAPLGLAVGRGFFQCPIALLLVAFRAELIISDASGSKLKVPVSFLDREPLEGFARAVNNAVAGFLAKACSAFSHESKVPKLLRALDTLKLP